MPDRPDLDSVVHAPLRLAVLTILSTVDQADFNHLKQLTESSDGNLSIHLQKLERAGYVKSKKRFVERKPQTTYRMTAAGREALLTYVHNLKQLLAVNSTLLISS
jgi:DNA-binding PadR family transcriptional regulator